MPALTANPKEKTVPPLSKFVFCLTDIMLLPNVTF